ncbi:GGDEF domain-containing protein [Peribacillus sp. NPDC096379]|uniref:GGDEF domain-containing protein n=1 Tax=Peribacillus sp. NPDC096379 TaxID=3364393 RepID=UPI00382AE5E7
MKVSFVLLLTLTNLDQLNDQYGHLFGDKVIKQVSDACMAIFRKTDIIGRFGGDEFVVILRDVSLETGKKRTEQLNENLKNNKITKDGNSVSISASIGVADNSQGLVKTFHELFHLADLGLYEAKRNGKNQIYVYE